MRKEMLAFASLRISHLLFADDLAMVAKSIGGTQWEMDQLKGFCDNWQLTVSELKTKAMQLNTSETPEE